MKVVAALGLAVWLATGPASAAIKTPPTGCASFIKDFPGAVGAFRASFERPLTISRGFGEVLAGVDIYVLATNAELEGTLKCRGDQFLRFELRIEAPATEKVLADFASFEQASLIAALHFDRAKAETVVKAMSADAAEYLKASEQRGDVYLAGKVEYHQGDALDLGVIWTPTDHSFVITGQSDD